MGIVTAQPPSVGGRLLSLALAATIAAIFWRRYRSAWIPTVVEWHGPHARTITVTTPGLWRPRTRRYDARRYSAARVLRERESDETLYLLQLLPGEGGPPVDVLSSFNGYRGRDLARVARRALRPALAASTVRAAPAVAADAGAPPTALPPGRLP